MTKVTLRGMDIPEHMTPREAVYYIIDTHKRQGKGITLITIPQFTYYDFLADTAPRSRFLCSVSSIKIDGIPIQCLETTSPHYSMALEDGIYWLPSDKPTQGETT